MDWGKERAEAGIASFQAAVIDADVETVETPTGRKEVEIAYQASHGFEVESGRAIGVYYEPDRMDAEVVHIDWEDRERTSIPMDDVEFLDEGEYE